MTSGDIDTRLARFLFQYRITPHTATGVSPAELLMGRKLQSHLDLLRPDVGRRVQRRQSQQKAVYDQHAHEREYLTDDPVYVQIMPLRERDGWLAMWLQERGKQITR